MQVNKFIMVLSLFFITFTASSQICKNYITDKHPNSRYSIHNNGTVTDLKTKLMWKVCPEGQNWTSTGCTGSGSKYNWQQALQQPSAVNTGGGFAKYDDWRLPNIKELSSLTARNCNNPAININIFPHTTLFKHFWSSSPYVNPQADNSAWLIYFIDGTGKYTSRNTNYNYAVRLVRDGQ